jgi:hypothetical protein
MIFSRFVEKHRARIQELVALIVGSPALQRCAPRHTDQWRRNRKLIAALSDASAANYAIISDPDSSTANNIVTIVDLTRSSEPVVRTQTG